MNPSPITSTTPQAAHNESRAVAPAIRQAAASAAAVTETVAATTKPASVDKEQLKNSVDEINRFLKSNSEVQFSIDDSSGQSIIKVVDTETKKILRQFPSEQALEIGKDLQSKKGVLLKSIA
ncbi:MAG: flagellar protein FlaG [Sphingomonadaceae bacterium]